MTTTYAGRFDFEDGGTYCGGWEDGKAHGFGVCTGPKSMGEFSGMWQFGYEVSGVYMWPSGNSYLGQWMSGKRHGLGVEKKQRWIYKGEWSQGFKGRYGVRVSETSGAKYEGTWANGLQDGYGSETYADGGTYFGQMSQGMRNGYGIRKSVSYGVASRYRSKDIKDSLTSLRSEEGDERLQRERDRRFDENRGGFVLRAKSDLTEEVAAGVNLNSNLMYSTNTGNVMTNAINGLLRRRRNSFGQSQDRRVSLRKTIMSKLKKQKSVGDIDEVNTVGGGSHSNTLTTSSGRAHKKSSFRSTSSNNSVDSRASNRTAPAGLGLNTLTGGHVNLNNPNQPMDDGEHSFISQDEITDVNCIEVYMGEWKQDKRTGYGIAERSDGLKYEGEWFNNKKNGYGVTTFKDGTKEEGKYKNNVLATDKKKTAKLLLLRSNKIRQKIDAAVNAALKAGQIAQQRADIALARAVNARTKSHASEIAAKQARADSDYARIKAKEVAPDFVQPGEIKKLPDIPLDIDRMGNTFNYQPQLLGLADPVNPTNNISPNQFRKIHQHEQQRGGNGPGGGANSQEQFWHVNHTPHSSTPPPQSRLSNTNINQTSQYFEPNLIIPTHQLHQQQQQQQILSQHPSIDQKLNNELLGLNPIDAQALAHFQHQQQQQQHLHNLHQNHHPSQKHLFQQNYSFDEQLANNYYDGGVNNRMNLLQQAQSHSFNMDMLNNVNPNDFILHQQQQQQQLLFQRNNPKRNTLRRAQRVMDTSTEDLSHDNNPNQIDLNLMGLSPQQQQQILLMRQQYSNNSSVQESGLGSSVYTNSAHGTHDLLVNNINNSIHPNNQRLNINNISPNSHTSHSSNGDPTKPDNLLTKTVNNINNNNNNNNNNTSVHNGAVSGVSNQDSFLLLNQPVQLPRRKSLPSIVKTKSFKEDDTAHSSSDLNEKNQEIYIIENGIRKRVTEKSNSALNQNKLGIEQQQINTDSLMNKNENDYYEDDDKRHLFKTEYEYDETPQLPRKIILESVTSLNSPNLQTTNSKRVSMPSIPAYLSPKFANKVMSREEANRLSSLRREELRKNRELENNRALRLKNMLKTDTIGMFFKTTSDSYVQTDDNEEYCSWIKDVFLRNRLFLFIVLFNISLAIWFLQMLK